MAASSPDSATAVVSTQNVPTHNRTTCGSHRAGPTRNGMGLMLGMGRSLVKREEFVSHSSQGEGSGRRRVEATPVFLPF